MSIRNPYQTIGQGYSAHRRPDGRIAEMIERAVGSAQTVVNVGAGTGAYEPVDRRVIAVEPSRVMIEQRTPDKAPVVQAFAERLPFRDNSFDVGMAILTVHHWTDVLGGLAELRRVSRRQVILTWDQAAIARYWMTTDYLPEIAVYDARLAAYTAIRDALDHLGAHSTTLPVPIPADCTDGFLAAYWARPAAYLDPQVRQAISGFALLDQSRVEPAIQRLATDLESGHWQERHADLLAQDTLDVGYRLLVVD